MPLDFMIIGAQKAGTSALSYFLSQHPKIAMAKEKEVHLFSNNPASLSWAPTEIDSAYQKSFSHALPGQLRAEATPIYLYWPPIVPALKKYNPELKIIVILRDPIDRAISQYQMEFSRKNEKLPIGLAFLLEPIRLWLAGKELNHAQRCHSYLARGLYAEQLTRLRQSFSDQQILIIENQELREQHQQTLNKVCEFLGLESVAISAEKIFEADKEAKIEGWPRKVMEVVLGWYFAKPNRRLKSLLNEMRVSAEWSWLNENKNQV